MRGSQPGDLICEVLVETPVKLTKQQKDLLRQFHDTMETGHSHSPKKSSWFDGMKSFFDDMTG